MEIVEASINDVCTLAKLNQRLIQDEGHGNNMSLHQLNERMSVWLSGEYQAVLFVNAEVLGYALWRDEKEFVYLRHFYIQRGYRRRGVGTEAYRLLASGYWCSSLVKLEVLSSNDVAQQFWRSLGSKQYSLYYGKRFLTMRTTLYLVLCAFL
jgi:ribosomal protein S18 acetylase RimI-like enzyme